MEEMDAVVRQEIDGDLKPEPSHWYEGHISLEDAKTFIKSNITTAARSFIAIGFYLKCVRDRGLFAEDNYQDVWDFAKSEYGISKSTASRYMSMNDRFSENGNSPNIKTEYRAFGKSQLQEMLYLEDEQLDQVKPGDRVEDIRNLRRPKEIPYIELPGQMDFEIDFPDILPMDQIEQPVQPQKQTFEMSIEDMLSGEKQESIAISQQDQEPEELQDRAAYVKEQYRLRDSFLNPFAVWLIKNHKAWFMEDHMNRVIKVDKSEGQLKSYLGAYPDGSSSYGFPVDSETYYAKLYDNRIVISHFIDGGTVEVDGTAEWFYLVASVQVQWNAVALEEVQEERRAKENRGPGVFNSTPTSCPHREEYSCTVLAENKSIPGDGRNCGSSCCWTCKFQGMCKFECNSSAGSNGTFPEYDAAWFVREWAKRSPGDLKRVLGACRRGSTNAERAKAVQEEISPYGAYCHGCREYDFSFHGFAGGIDLEIGKVETHLKYGRFVQELMNKYPDFQEHVGKEPEVVIEEPESVPEYHETVIDGEYEEILPDLSAPVKTVLEEAKKTLKDWMSAFEGEVPEKWPPFIERQKIIVAALEAMAEDQEQLESESESEPVKLEQPELPLLKNNDQRAAFIDAYETWPIWVETKETGERYYRYDLSDKVAIVVKVYWKHSWESYKESKDYEYGAAQYYLLGVKSEWHNGKNVYVEDESRTFYECSTNRSALVEYLKDFQKSK